MAAKKPARNFGGRPRKNRPEHGERTHLSAAVPLPLKQRLEHEAAKRGWSLSNEVTYRLEMSLENLDLPRLYQAKETLTGPLGPLTLRSSHRKREKP